MSRTATINPQRRDKTRRERDAFERLRAELTKAFAAPERSYVSVTAAEVIARNKRQGHQ